MNAEKLNRNNPKEIPDSIQSIIQISNKYMRMPEGTSERIQIGIPGKIRRRSLEGTQEESYVEYREVFLEKC